MKFLQSSIFTSFFISANCVHKENKEFFTRIQSNLSEINKSLMDLSGMGQDTKENIKNLASMVIMSKKEIYELKTTNGILHKTNSETINEIKSNLNEKFKTSHEFELVLGQFKQKSKIDEDEIKILNDTIEKLKQENSELKRTNGILHKTHSESLNEIISNLNEKFKTTCQLELKLGQFTQKSKTDDNEIISLNDTIEKLKVRNSELKTTVKILTNLNSDSSNDVQSLKNKLEQANKKIANQLSEHLISMEKCQKEKENLEAKLARSNKNIEDQSKEFSKSLENNQELIQENEKLNSLAKSRENLVDILVEYEKEVGDKNSEIEKLVITCEEVSNSLAKCQEEKENLEAKLATSNKSFGNKCEELTMSLKVNQELVEENDKLKKNYEKELKNLQENLMDANSKKTIQSKERQKLENQMNILMDLMKLPKEKRNFCLLREEIENLMSEHIKEKERAENLATNSPMLDSTSTDTDDLVKYLSF